MAKYFVVAFVALLALQGALAKPKAKQAESSPLEELTRNTESLVNNVTQALGIKDLPDSKTVIDALSNNTQKLADGLQGVLDKVKEELKAHQGEADSVLKQVQQKLTETVTSLQQAAGPDATKKAQELKKSLDDGLKTAVAQVDKLVKAVEPDATKAKATLENAAQTALNQINDIANDLKAKVEDHEKTHKH